MATSSITKNFVIEGKEQVEKFADAVEASYQESLTRKRKKVDAEFISGKAEMDKIIEIWGRHDEV